MKRKNVIMSSLLTAFKLLIQLLGNRHYGFHRDELLHLSVSEHLDWGFSDKNADTWISLGNEKEAVKYLFEETQLVKIIKHKYAIGEENEIPLYICRKPKIDIEVWWKDSEAYIFD